MAKTRIAMARQGHQYSRGNISLSWPHGGEREVIALDVVPQDIQIGIAQGRFEVVDLPVTKGLTPPPGNRLLTGEEARAHKALPAAPVTRQKFVDGELVQVPVIAGANLPPREEIGVTVAPEAEKALEDHTRKELDAIAAELGVEEVEKLPNKAAVIEAIEAAREAAKQPAPEPTPEPTPEPVPAPVN